MEKSIESIWKEGFLETDKLVAPKLNNLYNQKSKNIIDKIKRMMNINIWMIVIFSVGVLIWWYFIGLIYIGIFICLLLNIFAFYAKRKMSDMRDLEPGVSSYHYLVSFDEWIKTSISNNVKITRFLYPLFFLAAVATAWFSNDNETVLQNAITEAFPNVFMIGGIPVVLLVAVTIIAALMVYFGERIYRWDVNIVYGRVFRKLEEIISDMEELRS